MLILLHRPRSAALESEVQTASGLIDPEGEHLAGAFPSGSFLQQMIVIGVLNILWGVSGFISQGFISVLLMHAGIDPASGRDVCKQLMSPQL